MLQAAGAGGGLSTEVTFNSSSTFNTAEATYCSVSVDPNNANKFAVAYKDKGNSNYGTIVIGTISGNSISFGSEVVFYSAKANAVWVAFSPHTSNQLLISYSDGANSYIGKMVVGTVSGTSVSFGSHYTYNSSNSGGGNHEYDPHTANKFAITSYKVNGWYRSAVWVGTISGTSISFGSGVTAYSDNVSSYNHKLSFDPNNSNKLLLFSAYGTKVYVGTISGTSISFGSGYSCESGYSFNAQPEIIYDRTSGSNKFVCLWKSANTDEMKYVLGTVSGSTISFETPTTWSTSDITSGNVNADMSELTDGRFVVSIRGTSYNKQAVIICHIDGSSIECGDWYEDTGSGALEFSHPKFDPNNEDKVIVGYRDGSSGKARVLNIS